LEFDENQLAAFSVLDKMFFKRNTEKNNEPLEFVVRTDKNEVMTYDEIIGIVKKAIDFESAHCEIKIYSCTRDYMLEPINKLLSETPQDRLSVEHLVKFYDNDDYRNALAFKAIMPLLQQSGYELFQRGIAGSYTPEIVDDSISIKLPDKFILLIFTGSKYHDCIISKSSKWTSMSSDRWENIKSYYEPVIKERNVSMLMNLTEDHEESGNSVLIKSAPCFHFIQKDIWEALITRGEDKHYLAFSSHLDGNNYSMADLTAIVETLIASLDRRYKRTYAYKSMSVFSKDGLRRFVENGEIFGKCKFLPFLTKDEAICVLRRLVERHFDPADKLSLCIVDGDMDDNLIVGAYSDGSVAAEYNSAESGLMPYYSADVPYLSKLLMTYGEKYLPDRVALRDMDISLFIESLAKSVSSEENLPKQ
jgi:hypothetical protein